MFDSASKYAGGTWPGEKVFFVDSDFTVPRPVGPPKITFPFEGDSHAPTAQHAILIQGTNPTGFKYDFEDPDPDQTNGCAESYILEQKFRVAAQWFSPLPLDTPYDFDSYFFGFSGTLTRLGELILVGESPTVEVDGGLLEWTRTYATIPRPRNIYESFTFTFPGIDPGLVGDNSNDNYSDIDQLKRLYSAGGPATYDVTVRVEHVFILVPGGQAISPHHFDRTSPFYIEPTFKPFFGTLVNKIDYVYDAEFASLVDWKDRTGAPENAPGQNTIPPSTNDVNNDADSGKSYADMLGVVEVCVRSTQIRPWRGNIYERITLWAIAL